MPLDVRLPELGPGISQATVLGWLKQPGDPVACGEPLLEVAIAERRLRVLARVSGTLLRIVATPGQTVSVGSTLATMVPSGSAAQESDAPFGSPPSRSTPPDAGHARRQRATPLAARMIAALGLEMTQLAGTGPRGIITRQDVARYAPRERPVPSPGLGASSGQLAVAERPVGPAPVAGQSGLVAGQSERRHSIQVPIAEGPSFWPPQAVMVQEVDLTALTAARKDLVGPPGTESHPWATSAFFAVAAAGLLANLAPPIAGWEAGGEHLVGLDVALPPATRLTALLRGVERKSLRILASELAELAKGAREPGLKADPYACAPLVIVDRHQGPTLLSVPQLRPPQVAILCIGAQRRQLVVLPTESGEQLAIRSRALAILVFDPKAIAVDAAEDFLASFARRVETGHGW